MSIRMKFVWGFLLCIVVSAGIVSGISVWKLNELSGADFRQASGHQLQVTNRFISLFFQENISKLRFLSNLPLIPQTAGHFPNFSQTTQDTMYDTASLSPQARELFSLLQDMRKSSSELAEVFIGYADGSIATSNPAVFTPGFDGRQRSWFKDALAAREDWNIGTVYQTLSKAMAVPITYRVKDASGRVIAVIGADIVLGTIEELFRSMQFGRTGYYTLVDERMRVLCSSKNPELVMKSLSEVAPDLASLCAGGGTSGQVTHLGRERLVNILRGIEGWYLISLVDVAEMREAGKGAMELILACSVVIILVLQGFAMLLARSVCRPLSAIMEGTRQAAAGKLDNLPTDDMFSGELLQLHQNLTFMVGEWRQASAQAEREAKEAQIQTEAAHKAMQEAETARQAAESARRNGMVAAAGELEQTTSAIAAASAELAKEVDESTRSSRTAAARLAEAATAMNEMNATVQEVARNASAAAEMAAETRNEALKGAGIVGKALESIEQVHQGSVALKDDMARLDEHTRNITQIVSVISDIADQTNLLALNAAIEAARAGEAGRGFAVVADEVRKLAEKTMNSTSEVSRAILSIQSSVRQSMASTDTSVAQIKQATEFAGQSGDALKRIVSDTETVADEVRAIATAGEEQSAASEEINRTIDDANVISGQTAEAMTRAAQSLGSLEEQTHALGTLMDTLKKG
ncbi:methyl-accepting chemotaxis protein [uncultured Desulfovibrio sp.]|uniref:methyl-accepting chemotaxis protein n=1 Tax=uncultured Desulfovibrio sp. TaxID=167968 RepID=UPI00260EF7AA|nr:methyl-accepting chemotaxis protein [uncultured Desulfovibrio sp.]